LKQKRWVGINHPQVITGQLKRREHSAPSHSRSSGGLSQRLAEKGPLKGYQETAKAIGLTVFNQASMGLGCPLFPGLDIENEVCIIKESRICHTDLNQVDLTLCLKRCLSDIDFMALQGIMIRDLFQMPTL
jgi:hypothetical protein